MYNAEIVASALGALLQPLIDRLEDGIAGLVRDGGATVDVPRSRLPAGCREGTVLRVEGPGRPDWSRAVIDEAERARRVAEARERLDRLKQRDSGGDIRF